MKVNYKPNAKFSDLDLDFLVLDCCGVTGEVRYFDEAKKHFRPVYDSSILLKMNSIDSCNVINKLKSQIGEHYDQVLGLKTELFIPMPIREELKSYTGKLDFYRSRSGLKRAPRKKYENLLSFTSKKVKSVIQRSEVVDIDASNLSEELEEFMAGKMLIDRYNPLSTSDLWLLAKSYALGRDNPLRKIGIATADKMILATHYLASEDPELQHFTENIELVTRPYLENRVLEDIETFKKH